MRNLRRSLWVLALPLALSLTSLPQAASAIAVGDAAPAFELVDSNGKTHRLADLQGKVVVLEWVNPNCPFSDRHAKEKTMSTLVSQHGEVTWLGINSTNAKHKDYLTAAKMNEWATKNGVNYALLEDASGTVGKAYDAKTTPHMIVVGKDGKVVYNGAIDNDPPGKLATTERDNYVAGALGELAAGQAVDPATTKPYGCSVKY
jgi:peroxiredoxin